MSETDFRDLPRLDACNDIPVHVQACTAGAAVPDDPKNCALAQALRLGGFEARVMNEVVLVQAPATREVIRHNRERGNRNAEGVRPGDLVHYRYRLSKTARAERRAFDGQEGFTEGYYTLRAPSAGFALNRDKRSATRRDRADAYRDGTTPSYRRQSRLMRAALVHAELRASSA